MSAPPSPSGRRPRSSTCSASAPCSNPTPPRSPPAISWRGDRGTARALRDHGEGGAARDAKDLGRARRGQRPLSRLIIDAARSDHLTRLITIASDAPLSLSVFSRYTAEELERSMRHHREVVDALAHRDPAWAGSAMRTHILLGHSPGARRQDCLKPAAPPRPLTDGTEQLVSTLRVSRLCLNAEPIRSPSDDIK